MAVDAVAQPTEDRPATELVGTWAGHLVFESPLGEAGEGSSLVIRREASDWRAEIGGLEVRFDAGAAGAAGADSDRLAFELPDGAGAFQGRLVEEEGGIRGHWIQPPAGIRSQPFATPVHLRPVGPSDDPDSSTWTGTVEPLVDSLALYLVLRTREDGSVGAFLRNPDRNIGRFVRFGSVVERQGRFALLDPANEGTVLESELRSTGPSSDRGSQRLTIFFPQAGRTVDFRPIEADAPGFAPRSTSAPSPGSRPPELGDGWATATPADVGLDPAPLRRLVERISALDIDSVSVPYLHSLLIARRGRLVMESYFHGHDRDRPHDTRSAGKSFGTTLVGTAIDRGAPFSVDTPLYSLMAKRAGLSTAELEADSRRGRLRIRHLLSMSSGLHCDDGDSETPGNEDRMQSQSEEPDWIRYALRLPMAWEPGEHDVYCSADMHLLAGVLAEATGRWVPELFDEHLARPLDFGRYHLNLDPANEGYLGGGMRLRARDFLKLGQVFADGGAWNGRRIVSKEWIEQAVAAHSSLNEDDDYGFGWWRAQVPWRGKTLRTFYASGNGGQLVIAIPELEMVVAFQAANYADYRVWRQYRERWLVEDILSAVVEEAP